MVKGVGDKRKGPQLIVTAARCTVCFLLVAHLLQQQSLLSYYPVLLLCSCLTLQLSYSAVVSLCSGVQSSVPGEALLFIRTMLVIVFCPHTAVL